MIIRPANLEKDALAIMDGAHDFANRTFIKHVLPLPKNEEELIKVVSLIMSLEGMEVLVAEDKDRIIGGIGVLYAPCPWNPAIIVADQIFIWCARNAPFRTERRLTEEAMKNVTDRGALPMFRRIIKKPHNVSPISRFYRSFNMIPIMTVYTWTQPQQPS